MPIFTRFLDFTFGEEAFVTTILVSFATSVFYNMIISFVVFAKQFCFCHINGFTTLSIKSIGLAD
jgi:hypothetical protein